MSQKKDKHPQTGWQGPKHTASQPTLAVSAPEPENPSSGNITKTCKKLYIQDIHCTNICNRRKSRR